MYSDYYVYFHRRGDNGQVFYIGKGRNRRAWLKTGRGRKWAELVDSFGFTVEIFTSGLTNEQAISLELDLIQKTPDLINVIRSSRYAIPLDFDYISKYVEYDEGSPSMLRWKITKRKIRCGDICGVLRSGRYSFSLNKNRYTASRVVWVLHNRQIDVNKVIDHIDGNPLNNRISNLREVTSKENSNNTKKHRKNDPFLGVVEYSSQSGAGCYGTYYDAEGKEQRKTFTYNKHGREQAMILAKKFREEGLKKCYQS